MALTGKRKAAMLLMSLDNATATELLRGMTPDDIEKVGLELARLEMTGLYDIKEGEKVVRDFVQSVKERSVPRTTVRSFLTGTVSNLVTKDTAAQIQSNIRRTTEKSDPFAVIRMANVDELVLTLEGEHSQTIAMVLEELPSEKGQQMLSYLSDDVRRKVVWRMANPESLASNVRERIASTISFRLRGFAGRTLVEKPGRREEALRKLAMVLGGLERQLRDEMMEEIKKHDEQTCSTIRKLMVTWEDIPSIADRSLQEALRTVDGKVLAVAIFGATEEIMKKIRSNISERMAASLDEEASLMQEPLPKEILEAREEVMKPLLAANEEGKLRFLQR